ncbi:hypothetical protein [Azohydromonas lata]|uniref:Uncharacterized protein n=1 Tax=Azohydromonas lata TaxID=45677 RepID=A0ABU5IBI0_9BURK|nr:hypothetical protein [Azohydromonas lata]MDZ5455328.1 hypothetical protein [Azohydromonas lata]
MQYKQLSDGSYIVAPDGANLHTDHLHLASDRKTVLSHKVNGEHSYKYSNTRRSLSDLWEDITGLANKFPGGFKL